MLSLRTNYVIYFDNRYSIYQLNVLRRKKSNICEGHELGFNIYPLINSWHILKVLKKRKKLHIYAKFYWGKNVIDSNIQIII